MKRFDIFPRRSLISWSRAMMEKRSGGRLETSQWNSSGFSRSFDVFLAILRGKIEMLARPAGFPLHAFPISWKFSNSDHFIYYFTFPEQNFSLEFSLLRHHFHWLFLICLSRFSFDFSDIFCRIFLSLLHFKHFPQILPPFEILLVLFPRLQLARIPIPSVTYHFVLFLCNSTCFHKGPRATDRAASRWCLSLLAKSPHTPTLLI